jgi:polysaccharide deacetylase family protein (PEP-CTERM system associated)
LIHLPKKSLKPALLFSIDLEEFYTAQKNADPRSTSLHVLVEEYLEILKLEKYQATFFVVGDVARKYPEMLCKIVRDGHELGCHGDKHLTLDYFNKKTFIKDLQKNRQAVEDASGQPVYGFRAPLLSLVKSTSWAHSALKEEGFLYSSSVFPDRNPLYGWPDFGDSPCLRDGVWELPVTPTRVPLFGRLPLFCGTYFRVIPWLFIKGLKTKPCKTAISYFHPYDIDYKQPFVMHQGVAGNYLLNVLLFIKRKKLPQKIKKLLKCYSSAGTYHKYIKNLIIKTKPSV